MKRLRDKMEGKEKGGRGGVDEQGGEKRKQWEEEREKRKEYEGEEMSLRDQGSF